MGNGEMKLNRYPKYKPTGIAWLPELPEGWELLRFKALFVQRKERNDPIKTKNILSLTAAQGVVPVSEKIGAGGNKPKEDLTQYDLAYPDDLVLNCMNVVAGSVGVSKYFGAISPVYYALRARDRADVMFYNYIFQMTSFQRSLLPLGKGILMHESSSGKLNTVRLRISMNALGGVKMPAPTIEMQRAIVAFLDGKCGKIDRWVAAKEREVALLKELKQAMIAEAVTGATHVARTDTARKMKPSGIPWLPEVPEGWEVKRLKWILTEIKKLSLTGEEMPLSLTASNGLIPFAEKSNRTMESASYIGAKVVENGQIVFNRFKARLFAIASCRGVVSPDYAVYATKIEVDKKYLLRLFSTPQFRQAMNGQSSGIGDGFSRVYSNELFKLLVPLPPLPTQRKIVAYIEARAAKIDAAVAGLEREVAAMKEYKQRLIADVVTGQRKVA